MNRENVQTRGFPPTQGRYLEMVSTWMLLAIRCLAR